MQDWPLRSAIDGIEWPAVPGNAGSSMLATLFQLEQSQWLCPEQIWTRQRRQLLALLRHAADRVPFYRERISRNFLNDDFSAGDFAQLPLLKRADLQQSFAELHAQGIPAAHGGISSGSSSGSTGEPVRFLNTVMVAFFWHAFMLREHLWHRRDLGAKMLVVRVEKEPIALDNWFGDVGKDVFRTGPCILLPARWTFDRQLERVLREEPQYLLGYASNVLGIFRLAERQGVKMPWLREVRSFGEAVPQEMRNYIRNHWAVPLTDSYTAREVGYLAIQCPDHDAYHVQAESAFVEVIGDNGRPCKSGEIGRIIVTPLHNFAMPMVRYDIGDYAEVGTQCACGRGLPVLRRILGRTRNILRLPDGSMRWPTMGTDKLLAIAPIRRIKAVQKSLQDIEVRVVPERAFTQVELAALRDHFLAHFGPSFNVRFVFFEEFPPQTGDKFEDFVSEVS